ncbi:hypothetical protein [Streptococcus uberis]|uniref:hypothetical protein n=1 Tax=Streptococcus uberis TaxID=1349 RepID=UPI0019394539|nr:hypothetical protein [Streptococcus uberis]
MRLKEINRIFWENIPNLKFSLNRDISATEVAQILDYAKAIGAIENIRKTGLIEREVEELIFLNFPFNSNSDATYETSGVRIKSFVEINKKIVNKGEVIKDIVEKSYQSPVDNEHNFLVVLPNRPTDLKQFKEITSDLEKVFSNLSVFDEFKNQNVILEDFDIGSNWMILLFQTAEAVTLFSTIVSAAIAINGQIQNYRILKKGLETIDIAETEKQAMLKISSDINQKFLESFATEILENENPNPEKIAHLSKAIELTNNLVVQGVNFEVPKIASDEIRKNIPSTDYQKTLDTTKLIERQLQITEDKED